MEYDFVIVGAGSAGCVVAARLSEDPACKVALVEAGPDCGNFDQMPPVLRIGSDRSVEDPAYLWSYDAALTPEKIGVPRIVRGRLVGGSGAVNGSAFVRALPEDFDSWGSELWTFASVLPFLKRLESDRDFHDDYHGSFGPIPVTRHLDRGATPMHAALYESALLLGFPEKRDHNHPSGGGVGPKPMNNLGGVRMSTAEAYLANSRPRPNLHLLSDCLVTRVLLDGQRAVGVEARIRGESSALFAGEVVLSAGTFGSPHLLMLSGIGPAADLKAVGIDPIQHIGGVGMNLQCHPNIVVRVAPAEGYSERFDEPRMSTHLTYTANGSSDRNDMMITGQIACNLFLPRSSGEVRLQSPDPTIQPAIDYRYLDSWDLTRLREGVRTVVALLKQDPLRRATQQRLQPTDETLESDATLDRWIVENIGTAHHACGTCKLGPATDDSAVVDEYCRVRGVTGLRVIDLSIVPHQTRAGTHSTAVMVGERAADMILHPAAQTDSGVAALKADVEPSREVR